jgi:hypothetical protein
MAYDPLWQFERSRSERNMDQDVLKRVKEKVVILKSTYSVAVTGQAELILGECFTAIKRDPHNSWPKTIKPDHLEGFEKDMLNSLPSTLANFAMEQKLSTISSFDLLHAMTKIIDHMCPFMKPPPA